VTNRRGGERAEGGGIVFPEEKGGKAPKQDIIKKIKAVTGMGVGAKRGSRNRSQKGLVKKGKGEGGETQKRNKGKNFQSAWGDGIRSRGLERNRH